MADVQNMKAPKGRTAEARRKSERFRAKYEKAVTAELRSVHLTILVWGPNPTSNTPAAQKRRDIREKLLELGHDAMFSEDLPVSDKTMSTKWQEFVQASLVDLIILLAETPGSIAEAHDFCNNPKVALNMFVICARQYQDGYGPQGALRLLDEGYGGVYWYADGEIENCTVLTKAVARVEARRQIMAMAGG